MAGLESSIVLVTRGVIPAVGASDAGTESSCRMVRAGYGFLFFYLNFEALFLAFPRGVTPLEVAGNLKLVLL